MHAVREPSAVGIAIQNLHSVSEIGLGSPLRAVAGIVSVKVSSRGLFRLRISRAFLGVIAGAGTVADRISASSHFGFRTAADLRWSERPHTLMIGGELWLGPRQSHGVAFARSVQIGGRFGQFKRRRLAVHPAAHSPRAAGRQRAKREAWREELSSRKKRVAEEPWLVGSCSVWLTGAPKVAVQGSELRD